MGSREDSCDGTEGADLARLLMENDQLKRQVSAMGHFKRRACLSDDALLEMAARYEVASSKKSFAIAVNHHDRVVHASPRALRVLGYEQFEDIRGENVYNFIRGKNNRSVKAVRREIKRNNLKPDSFHVGCALVSRSRGAINSNLVVAPVYIGKGKEHSEQIYVGFVIRGESSFERESRLASEKSASQIFYERMGGVVGAVVRGLNDSFHRIKK